ncbi:MAG: hypothetical protein KIT80_17475 [Chitinophagaceae bacterium]|nr:hypothetical protein [Chitinophagaceae bacterium]MCW5928714.1 hypothetical protein [Chitinophagaceae bacterium]
MQFKKVIFVLAISLLIAGICLYLLPTNRKYSTETEINADKVITYRTLIDTANWARWGVGHTNGNARKLVDIVTDNAGKEFHYTSLLDDKSTVEGSVAIIKSNKWNTKILWTEKIVFANRNILQKLRLLFKPSEFKTSFLESIDKFKDLIEHPDNYFGGLTFEKVSIPANKFVVLSDTVALENINAGIYALRNSIISAIPEVNIRDEDVYYSQHELIGDSAAYVRVGVIVKQEVIQVPPPFDLLDMDEYQAIVMQVNRKYSEITQDVAVMHQWLKKNNARPAFDFWVEHHLQDETANAGTPVTIIQEFYSVK